MITEMAKEQEENNVKMKRKLRGSQEDEDGERRDNEEEGMMI